MTIPGVMISQHGRRLRSPRAQRECDAATLDTEPNRSTIRSRRSPRAVPDKAGRPSSRISSAPGVAIVSAGVGTGTGSRTSRARRWRRRMSRAPPRCCVRQHPKLNQSAIKALLQNSTVDSNAAGDTDLTRQGVGALRVDRAAAADAATPHPRGVSFGRLNPLTTDSRERTVTVKDLSGKQAHVQRRRMCRTRPIPGVEVSARALCSVNGKGKAKFDIAAQVRSARRVGRRRVRRCAHEPDGSRWLVHLQRRQGHAARRLSRGRRSRPPACWFCPTRASARSRCATSDRRSAGRKASRWPSWAARSRIAPTARSQRPASGALIRTSISVCDVLEFGFVMERSFEHLSNLDFQLEIDTNGDGTTDCVHGRHRPLDVHGDSDPGQYAMFQFDRRRRSASSPGLAREHLGLQRSRRDPAVHAGHRIRSSPASCRRSSTTC